MGLGELAHGSSLKRLILDRVCSGGEGRRGRTDLTILKITGVFQPN
jgi:hypothetical protein